MKPRLPGVRPPRETPRQGGTGPRRPFAGISLDVDNMWSYMKTHGDAGWQDYPSYLDLLLPRVFVVLDSWGVTITFFVVGRDAARAGNGRALRQITDRGHDVGNHSLNHEPWLHLYGEEQLREEVVAAEGYIEQATGRKPIGFRGPGFTLSTRLLEILADNGYRYDASTLPTFLGPLARLYYFSGRRRTRQERAQTERLFGTFGDGRRPVRPFFWRLPGNRRLLEVPVTTIPCLKIPFHLSYLLYLSRFSERLMALYLNVALVLCRMTGTEPSFLLHPLDFLGGEDVPALSFFPGMDLGGPRKLQLVHRAIGMISRRFVPVSMNAHVASVLGRNAAGGSTRDALRVVRSGSR